MYSMAGICLILSCKACKWNHYYEEVGPAYSVEDIVTHPIVQPKVSPNRGRRPLRFVIPILGICGPTFPLDVFLDNGFEYGDMIDMTICHGGRVMHQEKALFAKSFGYVNKGETVIYTNELMRIAVATCMGNFRETWHVDYGPDWTVLIEKRE